MVIKNKKLALNSVLLLTTVIGLSSCTGGSEGEPERAPAPPPEVNFEQSIVINPSAKTVSFNLVTDSRGRKYTSVTYDNNFFLASSIAEKSLTTDGASNILRSRATLICQSLGLEYGPGASVVAAEQPFSDNTVNFKEVFNYDAQRTNVLIESRVAGFQIDSLTCTTSDISRVQNLFSAGGLLAQPAGNTGTVSPDDANAFVHPYGRTPFERLYNFTQRYQVLTSPDVYAGISLNASGNVPYLALLGSEVYDSQVEASPNDPFKASRVQSSRIWFRRALDRVEEICRAQGFSGATPYFDLRFRSESGRAFDQLDRDRTAKTYRTFLARSKVDINGDGELNDSDQYPWAVIRTLNCRSN